MALIICGECNNQYSDTRPDCPHCGAYREGMAPAPMASVDSELLEMAQARRYIKNTLANLQNHLFAGILETYKNGLKKTKRSVTFFYLHGQVVSFNSYMDADLNVAYTTISEVSAINMRSTVDNYHQTVSTSASVATRERDAVSDVSLTKVKITEIAVKCEDGKTRKFYCSGPEISFLAAGDPITLGFFGVNWKDHSAEYESFNYYGKCYNDSICPVMVISRASDAAIDCTYVEHPATFDEQIFSSSLGKWKYTPLVSLCADSLLGIFPMITIVNLIVLGIYRLKMRADIGKLRKQFHQWWYEQSEQALYLTDNT